MATDAAKELQYEHRRSFQATDGDLQDFAPAVPDHEAALTRNGVTSGARVPKGDWI